MTSLSVLSKKIDFPYQEMNLVGFFPLGIGS